MSTIKYNDYKFFMKMMDGLTMLLQETPEYFIYIRVPYYATIRSIY